MNNRHPYLKILTDADIKAGLLREFIFKGLHQAAIDEIAAERQELEAQDQVLKDLLITIKTKQTNGETL